MIARAICSILVLLAGALPAAGEVRVTLRPEQKQVRARFPFRGAKMKVFNGTGRIIRAASVRASSGGPTILVPLVVPPNTSQTIHLPLPAISVEQRYLVRLLGRDDPRPEPIASIDVPILWPADMVARGAFINPSAYDDAFQVSWPGRLLRNFFLLAVLMTVLLGGCLLLPAGKARLAGCLLIAVGAVAIALAVVQSQPIVVSRQSGGKITLRSRRTVLWRTAATGLYPVYLDELQWRGDDMVIRPGRGLSITLRPSQARVLRREGSPAGHTSGD